MKLIDPHAVTKAMIKSLTDDKNYYGDFGKQFLSNSDIKALLSNPAKFKEPQEEAKNLIEGRYFHQCILEPDKAKVFQHVDVASRNTKAYKEEAEKAGSMLLLTKEKEHIDTLVARMKRNFSFFDAIFQDGNKFEVPAVAPIQGYPFKGKADIVTKDYLIDLKTSSDIQSFRWSAMKYNYDSQAYIYQYLFGKPLKFFVIDKTSQLMGIYPCSEKFLKSGEEKVMRALAVYEKYYGDNPEDDVDNYIIEEVL